jgi:hypothetical protein
MSDVELLAEVRQTLGDLHMTVATEAIVKRGGALRARRRGFMAAALIGAFALPAVAESTLLTPTPALAAWSVNKASGGAVDVTIRQLDDIPGLEAQLRGDGAPSLVTASFATPASCTEWLGGAYSTRDILTLANETGLPASNGVEFTVHPSDIPQGALLWLGLAQTGAPAGSSGPAGPMSVGLLDNTAACAASG